MMEMEETGAVSSQFYSVNGIIYRAVVYGNVQMMELFHSQHK